MHVLPQTPLDWVLLAVASATAIIIAVAMQDFFVESAYRTYKLGTGMVLPSLARLFAGRLSP